MNLDHIGYVTDSIEDASATFQALGYTPEPVVDFPAHRCHISFLHKQDEHNIELVEPYEDNKSLRKLLKNGTTPYHLCYEVQDIHQACEELVSQDYLQLSQPLPAPAFDNRLICYLWHRTIGYIELLSAK